ncbi:MAG TPA: M48 family metalloprotease [Candidatus Binataceae bacterium]|nr:M48 family metalloprotease [Candidatus Binataceae bacterium]
MIPALCLCALTSVSCSTSPATGRSTFTGLSTTADEVRIGREQNAQLLEAFGGAYNDAALAAYVSKVGDSLAAKSERKDITYTFTVLDSPIVNAMALPGGYIYITRGLLALASSEAELAGVLGHEIGHVTGLHHAQRQSRQTVAGVAGLGVTVLGAIAGLPIGQQTQMLAGAFLASYTRDQEYEADLLGIRYMNAAGYDPKAMATFLDKLNAWTTLQETILGRDSKDQLDYLATHPNTQDRVRQALAAAGSTTITNAPMVGVDPYFDRIDGILYGEPIASGVIRGRKFIHPEMRIRFEVPEDYELFDSPQAVYAIGPGNSQIVFDSGQVPAGTSILEYVRQGAKQAGFGEPAALKVGSFEAATTWALVPTDRGQMSFRIVVVRVAPDRVYRFRFILPKKNLSSKLTSVEQSTLDSFATMTPKEAAQIKPQRVRVVTTQKGDTVEILAARMDFETYKLQRFQVLNGLVITGKLKAGVRVKIVIE